jgi:IGR protein motif
MSSAQLREAGVEPARARKYLMRWRERFRQGIYGIGGDLKHVADGVGHIRVFEVPVPKEWIEQGHTSATRATATRSPGMRKVALSVPLDAEVPAEPIEQAKPVDHVKIRGANTIAGKWVQAVKDTKGLVGKIEVREGLWEDKRGHKVDGGERRKAEVRSKRRAQERKEQRA